MRRRDFLKAITLPAISIAGVSLFPKRSFANEELLADLRIWSYYVPLTSYQGILEEFEGRHPLDQKVIFEEVIKKTNRISGKETDGTKNPDSFSVEELESTSGDFMRIRFWHDDNGVMKLAGHTLHVFKRYLEELSQGKNVFVATGMYQGHFHVVMIQAPK